jgi:hypothetical protein
MISMVTPTAITKAAGNSQAETYHLLVPAAAELVSSTCPFGDWTPEIDTNCEDWYVLYFREGEPSSLRDQPWILFVTHALGIVHPDGTYSSLFDTYGQIENPQGSFDENQYSYATVNGTVQMSDGSELTIDLTWDMTLAELHHGGNNSAYNLINGFDRLYNDRCLTLVQLAHQQWRYGVPGQISGSIGDVDVQSMTLPWWEPFIAGRSVFTYVVSEHGGCTLR